ncbi:hypothetical protein B0T18DRAFT_239127 [Schizothecium vesticola]|uniref:Uncharacterized protein n=1 Tax=Schizothecium vesticola TaxID=314040 RepID=A0AA40BPT8_9PEZI|nr:hypothetical protein B0T18DRAFT_239127 [Schizothecium vesticola]
MTSPPPLSYSGFGLPAIHTHYPRRRQSPYLLNSNSSSSTSSSSSSSSLSSSSSSSSPFVTALQSRSSSPTSTSKSVSRTPSPTTPTPTVRTCRRTPYYPPNSSRTADNKARVYMPRGPHYVANWTPLSTLSRGSQLMVEERMVLSLLF